MKISKGFHGSREQGMCAMETVAWDVLTDVEYDAAVVENIYCCQSLKKVFKNPFQDTFWYGDTVLNEQMSFLWSKDCL